MSVVTFMFFASSTGGGAQESPRNANAIEKAIAQAKSPAEREAIASFFRQEAANARTAADYHQQLADEQERFAKESERK
jgi:hypothetical protein